MGLSTELAGLRRSNVISRVGANPACWNRLAGAGARALVVSVTTLRRWQAAGTVDADRRGRGHRRYDVAKPPRATVPNAGCHQASSG